MSENSKPCVTVNSKGPYICKNVDVVVNGEVKNGMIALCSCGLSNTKPFCDGSHKAFDAATDVPADDGEVE